VRAVASFSFGLFVPLGNAVNPHGSGEVAGKFAPVNGALRIAERELASIVEKLRPWLTAFSMFNTVIGRFICSHR
jgi:hypothetical protein